MNYSSLRKQFLSKPENQFCKAKIPGICMGYRVQGLNLTIHHQKGRIGNNLNDTSHWLPCCLSCHNFIESNPLIAKELGFSENRLTNEEI
jgi:hypothetical protein